MGRGLPMDKSLQERFKRRMKRGSEEFDGQPFNFYDPAKEIFKN